MPIPRFVEQDTTNVTRRDFLSRAAVFAGYCALSCDLEAQQPSAAYGVPPVQALDDKNVIHGRVTFKSGTEDLDGYLARPNKKGRFPIVVIVAGNPPYEEYVRNMTAMFAQVGFTQIFTYTGAHHGFFAHTQPTYDADVSKIAWERTSVFLKKVLGH